jgi:ABC-type dipeptide/oligopeptide/nickel transport system permease subunit
MNATPTPPPAAVRMSWRDRLERRPLGIGLWVGVGILGVYLVAALSAIAVFWSSLGQLPTNLAWLAPHGSDHPTWAHPFGILPGIGTDLLRAVWQATPLDLGIVAGTLSLDAVLGWMLGALAGMNEGGAIDSAVVFVGDTVGSIPSFFLVIVLFAGWVTFYPAILDIPLFVLLFGLVLWPATARTTRERARWVARQPFLEAARASGASRRYLYFRHILPNSVSPLLAQLPIDVAPIFFVLSVFPWFYDCGTYHPPPPGAIPTPFLVPTLPPYSPLPSVTTPEWGNLLAVGTCEGINTTGVPGITFFGYWWMYLFPLLAILLLGIAIALVCDGLDRAMKETNV